MPDTYLSTAEAQVVNSAYIATLSTSQPTALAPPPVAECAAGPIQSSVDAIAKAETPRTAIKFIF